ncbi:unnamed protein product [Cuscuta epithymum]|uniref:Protein kinase domain-containing protein n=1 Tax=Cuscuta epithymum TaxID=186058 RepID=A0AAV0ECV7_9ASTE|nr:unnamed protein product [Cuscuta epithymum]
MAKSVERSWVRERCIGKGSFAAVNLAFAKKGGGVFAVKSVDAASSSPSRIESLENEIRILRSLSSPYVVKYLGDDVTATYRNLHVEYMPGGTAADLANRGEEIVRSYARCVVEALMYIHSKGIVHCDVKGQNVLVGPAPGYAKLADFGSAVEIGDGQSDRILPRGSPLWMAPEVIRGEYQGPESDVWSLGCTVIEMLTGKWPWEDRGAADTLLRIGNSDELPQFPAQLSESGCDFLEKCLQRDLKKRWSCDQLLQHPFLSVLPPQDSCTAYSSPRCVLNWFSSDNDSDTDSVSGTVNFSAKERIGKLASGTGANWESDGWVVVRERGVEEGGAISGYESLIRTEGQISSEYSDSAGIETSTSASEECLSSEIHGGGNDHGVVGPSSPQVPPVLRPVAGGGDDNHHIYLCLKSILFLLMIVFVNVYRCNCMTFMMRGLFHNYKRLLLPPFLIN